MGWVGVNSPTRAELRSHVNRNSARAENYRALGFESALDS